MSKKILIALVTLLNLPLLGWATEITFLPSVDTPFIEDDQSGIQGVSECARRRLDWMQQEMSCRRMDSPEREACLDSIGPDPGSCR